MGSPAYAGKRISKKSKRSVLEDHPRLCGEKPPSACTGGRCGGSPPPMRGKDLSAGQLRRNHRITPAYAGKSTSFLLLNYIIQDHPRLCGEKRFEMRYIPHRTGSPPPMRGKEGDDYAGIAKARITPAYAGKRI